MWNVEATVDAFDKLEDVPIGYWHVLLQDELPNGAAGLHKRDDNKQPSRPGSLDHELACIHEPRSARNAGRPAGNAYARRVTRRKPGKGRVEYLIEVCDPCQASKSPTP